MEVGPSAAPVCGGVFESSGRGRDPAAAGAPELSSRATEIAELRALLVQIGSEPAAVQLLLAGKVQLLASQIQRLEAQESDLGATQRLASQA